MGAHTLGQPVAHWTELGNPFETTKSFLDQVLVEIQGEHLLAWHLTGAEDTRVAIELLSGRQLVWA